MVSMSLTVDHCRNHNCGTCQQHVGIDERKGHNVKCMRYFERSNVSGMFQRRITLQINRCLLARSLKNKICELMIILMMNLLCCLCCQHCHSPSISKFSVCTLYTLLLSADCTRRENGRLPVTI